MTQTSIAEPATASAPPPRHSITVALSPEMFDTLNITAKRCGFSSRQDFIRTLITRNTIDPMHACDVGIAYFAGQMLTLEQLKPNKSLSKKELNDWIAELAFIIEQMRNQAMPDA